MNAMLTRTKIELLCRHDAAFVLSKTAGVPVGSVQAVFPLSLRPVGPLNRRVVSDDGDGLFFLFCLSASNAGTAGEQAFNSNSAKLDAPDALEATGSRRNCQAINFAEIVRAAVKTSDFLGSAMFPSPQACIRAGAVAFGSGTP